MINKNYIKPKLSTFLFVTFLSNLTIYLVQFYYFKESAEYFLCTKLINYDTSIFSRQLNLIYPESCDLKVYAEGITNFLSFYNIEEYVYLDRPLFIFYIFFFYTILNFIFSALSFSSLTIIKGSFFLGQLILTGLVCILLFRILNICKLVIGKEFYILPVLVSLSPMFKWHIFESTSMTFTFLIFLIGIYICLDEVNLNLNTYFLASGLLFLIHRSSLLILVLFFVYKLYKKEFNKKIFYNLIFFFTPIFLYYISIFLFSNYSDHQAQGYRQFIWIIDYLQGKETMTNEYFCQSPQLAIKCYLKDLINLFYYLAIPSIFSFSYIALKFKKFSKEVKNLIFTAILFTAIINFFWLFIGWYPPIRFSYYGYGNLIIFLLIYTYFSMEVSSAKALFLLAYFFYFITLNHWNNPEIIIYTSFIRIAILFFLSSLVMEFASNSQKYFNSD